MNNQRRTISVERKIAMIVLYFTWHQLQPETINKLVHIKLDYFVTIDPFTQSTIVDSAKQMFAEETPPSDWNEDNLSGIIAQLGTNMSTVSAMITLTEEEIEKIAHVCYILTCAKSSSIETDRGTGRGTPRTTAIDKQHTPRYGETQS